MKKIRQGGQFQTSLFFKLVLYEVKASAQRLSFNIYCYSFTWTHNRNKLYKTSDCWSRDMSNFDFLKKGLELVSEPHFVHDFSIWLHLFLEICSNLCIAIVCYPVCDIISFEIYLSFLIKPFSYLAKKLEQKCIYLKNKKSFKVK